MPFTSLGLLRLPRLMYIQQGILKSPLGFEVGNNRADKLYTRDRQPAEGECKASSAGDESSQPRCRICLFTNWVCRLERSPWETETNMQEADANTSLGRIGGYQASSDLETDTDHVDAQRDKELCLQPQGADLGLSKCQRRDWDFANSFL